MKKIPTNTKDYLEKYLGTPKDHLVVNNLEKQKMTTKEYLIQQGVEPILALKVVELKQDILKKKFIMQFALCQRYCLSFLFYLGSMLIKISKTSLLLDY